MKEYLIFWADYKDRRNLIDAVESVVSNKVIKRLTSPLEIPSGIPLDVNKEEKTPLISSVNLIGSSSNREIRNVMPLEGIDSKDSPWVLFFCFLHSFRRAEKNKPVKGL